MILNAKTNKVMCIEKGQYKDVVIDSETQERIQNFVYLGSNITRKSDLKPDFLKRIGLAKRKMIDQRNIWKDKELSFPLKLEINYEGTCVNNCDMIGAGP